MCRNIKTLFNFDPPATEEEIRAAALQFVRKLSGFNAPSKANQAAFDRAIAEVTDVARALIASLVTRPSPRIAMWKPNAPARDPRRGSGLGRDFWSFIGNCKHGRKQPGCRYDCVCRIEWCAELIK